MASFFFDAYYQKKKKHKPLVVVGPVDAEGNCNVVGFSGPPASSSKVCTGTTMTSSPYLPVPVSRCSPTRRALTAPVAFAGHLSVFASLQQRITCAISAIPVLTKRTGLQLSY